MGVVGVAVGMVVCVAVFGQYLALLSLATPSFRLLPHAPTFLLLLTDLPIFDFILANERYRWVTEDPLIFAELTDPHILSLLRVEPVLSLSIFTTLAGLNL